MTTPMGADTEQQWILAMLQRRDAEVVGLARIVLEHLECCPGCPNCSSSEPTRQRLIGELREQIERSN
jgi:hypothetical protein